MRRERTDACAIGLSEACANRLRDRVDGCSIDASDVVATTVDDDLLDPLRGCRSSPETCLDAPGGGETEKNIFGRSPAIGASGGAARSSCAHADGVIASSIPMLVASSLRAMRKAGKAALQLVFRAFTAITACISYGRSDVWMSRMKSTHWLYFHGLGRGVEGASWRFGNLLFPLRNLLTRALDSNSFCAGVTNK